MTFVHSLYPIPGRARWGVFHNLRTDEPIRFIYLHFAGRAVGLLWESSAATSDTERTAR